MNWNYFKFTVKNYKNALFIWIALIVTSYFLPFHLLVDEDAKDVHMYILCLIAIGAAVRSSYYDFFSTNQSAGKSTSMKYMLALNMSKREFYLNYLCSYYVLIFPTLVASVLAILSLNNYEDILFTALKSTYIGFGLIFLIANSFFYKRYFIHKEGTFQDQYIRGRRAYYFRIITTGVVLFSIAAFIIGQPSFLPFHPLALLVLVFIIPISIPMYWFLYVPFIPLFIFYEFKKSLKDFNNAKYFHGKFRNERREIQMGMVMFALCLGVFVIDTPPELFQGNKLTEAIYSHDYEKIKEYASKENLNKLSREGLSPLAAAAYTGQWDVYQFLKKKGATESPPVIIDKKENDLLQLSLRGRDVKIIEDVIASGKFDINRTNDSGVTPLHYIASSCRSDIAKILINNGAEINKQNKKGQTPLHISIQKSCNDLGLVLLSLGADPSIKDSNNKLAWDMKVDSILPYLEEQLRRPASIEED